MGSVMKTRGVGTDSDSIIQYTPELALRNRQRRWEACLIASVAFVAASGIFALAAFALPCLGYPNDRPTVLLGHGLLVLVYPAAIFIGHCLDKVKEIKRIIRLEAAIRSGLRQPNSKVNGGL